MNRLSVLDLCPILSGHTPHDSFRFSGELAQYVEKLGYHRYWVAEHHNMEGIGSSSPEVLISYLAGQTQKIRVGSGGIMLPNHASLHVAEVFRTLEALYPGRIDLGLGRAPGSGQKAAHLLRGHRGMSADEFPSEVSALIEFFHDRHEVSAVPSKVSVPEMWILGSSDWGAKYAAENGLPYAFAQHFSHLPALPIMNMYVKNFKPSELCEKPRLIMASHIICAETTEEAKELAYSSDLSFALFVGTGKSIPLPTVADARAYPFTERDWEHVRAGAMPKFVGSPSRIKEMLEPFIEAGLDELMVMTMVHDQDKRKKSYELIKSIF